MFDMNAALYSKDPQETLLGKKILQNAVILMDELGFESFTFKKLAKEIQSTEKSIYRYFDNKHFLLLYLTSWYWEWVAYLMDTNLKNIADPKKKLKVVIHNIIFATQESKLTEYINENVLHRIIINEGAKTYHVHNVDVENKHGLFMSYKNLVQKVADIIVEVNPKFKYSKSLSSNLFEMANNQIFFAEHIPRLTDIKKCQKINEELETMIQFYLKKLLA